MKIKVKTDDPMYSILYYINEIPMPEGGTIYADNHWTPPEGWDQYTRSWFTVCTDEVKNASKEMNEGNKRILEEMKVLQTATDSIKGSMDEMSVGAKKINETGVTLQEISGKVDQSIHKINSEVDQFKV